MAELLLYGLPALLALFVSIGLAGVSRGVSGGFIGWLANLAENIPIFGGLSHEQVVRLDRWITHELGKHFQATVDGGVRWISGLATYVFVIGYWTLLWPVVLYHFGHRLIHDVMPHAIKARTDPLSRKVDAAEAAAKAAAGLAHSFPKVAKGNSHVVELTKIERVAMPHAREWDWVHNHFKGIRRAVAVAAAGAIGLALPGHIALPRLWGETVTGIRKRLRRLEKLATTVGLATAIAGVLGLGTNWRCLTRGNIGRVSRALCGIGPRALEDLLGLLVDALILTDICQVLVVLEKGLAFVEPEITAFITAAETMACYGNNEHLPAGPSVALSLPPVTGLVLSLA